jgi:hypothetical protein
MKSLSSDKEILAKSFPRKISRLKEREPYRKTDTGERVEKTKANG